MDRRIVRTAVWKHENAKLEINVTQRYGCYATLLKVIKDQMDAMSSHYSRVLVVRLDLHMIEYTGNNEKISRMLDRLKEWLQPSYGKTRIGHLWVREMERAKQQHYHLALMIDERLIRHPHNIIKWIEHYWQLRDEPKPFTPRRCYTKVKRDDPQSYQKAFYRLSYLAKNRGKGYKDQTANNYSASRIKHKQDR